MTREKMVTKKRIGWILSGLLIIIIIVILAQKAFIHEKMIKDREVSFRQDLRAAAQKKLNLCLLHKKELATAEQHLQARETFQRLGCPEYLLYSDCVTDECISESLSFIELRLSMEPLGLMD